MSTRSNIGIGKEDGTVDYIYCHYDGYPEGVGQCLRDHYTTPSKIQKLIDGGDISTLGPNLPSDDFVAFVEEQHAKGDTEISEMLYFSKVMAEMTVSYNFLRNEKTSKTNVSLLTYLDDWGTSGGAEFRYLWDGERWQTLKRY